MGIDITLTLLKTINDTVNHDTTYISDDKHYGLAEYWEAIGPDNKGDCEDYALAKRQQLINRGVNPSLLNIGICKDKSGEGHAVLVVSMSDGDYVLDNQTDEILPWNLCGYSWIEISVDGSFKHWKSITA